MRVLKVTRVEPKGAISLFCGTVANAPIVIGDDVFLLSKVSGERDHAVVVGIVSDGDGDKASDVGIVGKKVKLTCRRSESSFPDVDVEAFEKAELV